MAMAMSIEEAAIGTEGAQIIPLGWLFEGLTGVRHQCVSDKGKRQHGMLRLSGG